MRLNLMLRFLSLALALIFIPLASAQIRLVGTKSRVDNMTRINKLTGEFNEHAIKYRALVEKIPPQEIKNFEASDELAEMSIKLGEMIQVFNAFDEVEP
jgi:hypothetical protein